MNKQIRQLAGGLMICYVALFVTLNYWQVGRKEELDASFDNTRAIRREFERPRGQILAADGSVMALSVATAPDSEFTFQRQYPFDDLFAHITGYYTFGFGSTQLERTQNDVLAGTTAEQRLRAIPGILDGDGDNSGTVVTTVRTDLQQVAKDALGEREGSVVVLEPSTGAVQAMWSFPSYNPNQVVDPDFDVAGDVLAFLGNFPGDPLLANTYQERYMPGSTFKILTTATALQSGVASLDTVFPDESSWVPPQTTDPIENFEGTACGGDLAEVFARSCNIPFAKMAVEIGPERMVQGVSDWGVGERIPFDLPRSVASTFGDTTDLGQNLPLLAIRGFGQNEVQMVPLHMAMAAAAVANGGVMMQPFVVRETLDHDGNVLSTTGPAVWKTPITPATATTLRDLMIGVAEVGTASCCIALDSGIPVAAKTGTGQLNNPGEEERSNAWIVAFAPADAPRYVVAVMLKGTNAEISAGTGGRLAGPIAKTVLDAAFAGEAGG